MSSIDQSELGLLEEGRIMVRNVNAVLGLCLGPTFRSFVVDASPVKLNKHPL